ncbi:tetratricopeptide repeat protein [Petrotoga halophila]|uniref:tetratricopeptide repeat protein n=2 Tax=Petrotoga halophila TaxID=301141 RepID=UPI000CDF1598|nr:tetratricopeptide repeat protein [Petrotoga halophila]
MTDKEWFKKGVELSELGRYEEALRAFEKAIEINPQDDKARFGKGVALGELGRHEDALEAYEKVIEINPQFAESWFAKGVELIKLGRYEDALKAYEKAIEINPQYADAWVNKGVELGEFERHEEALQAYEKAIEIDPKNALAYTNLGELFFKFGNLKEASDNVDNALNIDEELVPAWSLQGRIKIEEKDYDTASESFKQAMTLDSSNPIHFLWYTYTNYLKAEFSLDSEDKKYQEEITTIIRNLEKMNETLSKNSKQGKEIRAYVLYFLGHFYLKSNDIFTAKEKLEECIKLKSKSPIEAPARELLDNIWNYQIRPSLWRWWFNSPLHRWLKRIGFSILLLLILLILALLLLHLFVPEWYLSIQINWSLSVFLIVFLIIILFLPNIKRIQIKDIEIELHSPPPIPVLSPMVMEEEMKEIEAKYLESEKLR